MNIVEYLGSLPLTEALGWMLVHFVWQGALIAVLVWTLLIMIENRSANWRYITCCAGMFFMLASPLATLAFMLHTESKPLSEKAMDLFLLNIEAVPIWEYLSPFLPWLTVGWLAGTLVLQGRLILNWFNTQRLRRRCIRCVPVECRHTIDELCGILQVRSRVKIFESTLAQVPMVMGWLQPVILLPAYALTGLSAQQLRVVLAHELAHVRRGDYLVNLVQAVFESLFFYHPAVWWISNRLRTEREYCCDDVAVSVCRDALSYARALSSLDTLRDDECRTVLATTGGPLMKRIFRIMGVSSPSSCRIGGWLTPLVIASSLTAVAAAFTAIDMDNALNNYPSKFTSQGDDDPGKKMDPKQKAELEKKAQIIATKMKEEGKPEKEIKKSIIELYEKAGAIDEPLTEAELVFKKKVQKVVEEMRTEGKSDKEIKEQIREMEKEYTQAMLAKKDMEQRFKKEDEELIKKMTAAGKSKQEIKEALHQLHDKRKQASIESSMPDKDELIKKLKKKGLSEEEIKKYIQEQEMKKKSAKQ
ncbi:MAG: M56 family metallopeptidase [Planctomycetota bacterium]